MRTIAHFGPKNVIYGLYCTCHPGRGVRYVGQTSTGFKTRWHHHKSNAILGAEWPVSRWISKHGVENVEYIPLSVVEGTSELDALECFWIDKLQTHTEHGGCNILLGGDSIRGYKRGPNKNPKPPLSMETRAKISATLTGRSGEFTGNSKLKTIEVVRIKELLWTGKTSKWVAETMGTTLGSVHMISKGHTWPAVPWPVGPRVAMETGWFTQDKTGESHSASKMTDAQVIKIRTRFDAGEKPSTIAKDFPHVTKENVSMVANRKTWKHLP